MGKRLIGMVTVLAFFNFQLVNVSAANTNEENRYEIENEKIYVKTISKDVTVISNFNYDDESGFSKKVFNEELKSSTGKIDAELENALNEMGVLDEEIEDWKEEQIENLENATCINVVIQYGEEINGTDKVQEISSEEYYQEYYQEKYGDTKKNEKNVFKTALETIGIIPIEVEAATNEYDESETAKFKQTLVSCDTTSIDNRPTMYFMYEAVWKKTPVYNNKDCIKMEFGNGWLRDTTFRIEYDSSFTPTYQSTPLFTCSVSDYKYDKYIDYIGSESRFIYAVDLPGGKYGEEYSTEVEGRYDYSNVKISITGYVTAWNTAISTISTNGYYFHSETTSHLSLSGISVGIHGASLGISYSEQKQYNLLGDVNTCIEVPLRYK